LNYFNYFTEIEDAFIRRRGKHLLLSPMDWALIESWKEMKIPLHVALRGIEKAFDSWESKPRKRTVKSLLYCQEEVEAQYAEWLEAKIGTGAEQNEGSPDQPPVDEGLPFSRVAIIEHLERARSALLEACEQRRKTGADDLSDTQARVAAILLELEKDFSETASPNAEKLEESLTGLERMLSASIHSVAPTEQLEAMKTELGVQLRPYRNQMETAVYQQTLDNLLLKRLREHFAVPRLSLFYI